MSGFEAEFGLFFNCKSCYYVGCLRWALFGRLPSFTISILWKGTPFFIVILVGPPLTFDDTTGSLGALGGKVADGGETMLPPP